MTATRVTAGYPDAIGFAVHEGDVQTISNSGRWHPDTLDYASDDWTIDMPNGDFTSPDRDELYLVQAELFLQITGADEVWVDISINETRWNVDPISFQLVNSPNEYSSTVWVGRTAVILPLGPQCLLRVNPSWHPFGIASADILEPTYLRVFKYAELPT